MTRSRYALMAIVGFAMGLWMGAVARADATATPSAAQPSVVQPSATRPSATAEPADVPAPKLQKDGQLDPWFKKLHESFMAQRNQGPIDLLFLGDSITQLWSAPGKEIWDQYYGKLNAANFGISGDKTQHVLWRIDQGELDGISPKVVVLLIGTNNLRYTPEQIVKADALIVLRIHEKIPGAKVLVMGLFPRGKDQTNADIAMFRQKITVVNQGLAKLDDGAGTRFLDIGDQFLNADGSVPKPIMPDYLHPSAAGYLIWADAMKPLLDQMMK